VTGVQTCALPISPFTADHVGAFVPTYSARDTLRTYGIFGGLPGHLALLRKEDDLAANVARLIIDPGGRLADEAEHALDAFLTDADVHYSILQAIAAGERSWGKITSRVGKPGGSLSRPLKWLEEMHLVSRTVPITEDPRTSRRSLYWITDPYLGFWHRFIAPLIAGGETAITPPERLWQDRVLPGLDDYMGRIFEDICRSWVARTARLPFAPGRVGTWWDASATNEIDIVAIGSRGELLVAECKWGSFSDSDLMKLRERTALMQAELPPAAKGGPLYLACFSARGEWGPGVAREIAAGTVLGFTGEDVRVA
jgi:AAA+ ATPase superfamily predicted ATPase